MFDCLVRPPTLKHVSTIGNDDDDDDDDDDDGDDDDGDGDDDDDCLVRLPSCMSQR